MRPGDTISIRENSKVKPQIKDALEITSSREASSWLAVDREKLSGTFTALPERSQLDPKIQEHLIIEFYSR